MEFLKTTRSRRGFGSIYELKTSKGLVYLQYVKDSDEEVPLVRILADFYYKRPINLAAVANRREQFWIHLFGWDRAIEEEKLVHVGWGSPAKQMPPKYFRDAMIYKGVFKGWMVTGAQGSIRYLDHLDPSQMRYPPSGYWNLPFLIYQLEQGFNLTRWCAGFQVGQRIDEIE